MKRYSLIAVSIALALSAGCSSQRAPELSQSAVEKMTLEKVVMLSRHGIRAPLVGYGSVLAESTPQTWPQWQTKPGHLTPKGAKLESLFAQYLDEWFDQTGLLAKNQCPDSEVLIYTNSKPRTIESGESFAEGAFPHCHVKTHYLAKIDTMDNTFNPIVRSKVDAQFEAKAKKSIDEMLGNGGFDGLNAQLNANYQELERVLDYKNSPLCLQKQHCDFAQEPNTLSFAQGKEPKTTGPLRNGTGAGDSFSLQYYEGFTMPDVAWGKVSRDDQWQKLIDIKNKYNDVLFGSPVIAKEAATPLLTFIQNAFVDKGYQHPLVNAAQKAKIVLLVGHDSNVGSLLPLLKVKDYTLPEQFEKTPVSGKVAFEQWKDAEGKAWMKVEYLYQTTKQLREGTPLSAQNPAKRVTLELQDCPTNAAGFCPMAQFEKAVENALK